jgi:hypothetical protein
MATSPNYGWSEPDNSSLVKDGAQAMRTLGDAIDTSVWNVGYGQAGKNKIINGDMSVWQRGINLTVSAQNQFLADRWKVNYSVALPTSWAISQQSFTAGTAPVAGYEGTFFMRSAITTIGSAASCRLVQPIEDVRTFAGQTVTLSFWAKADSSRTIVAYLTQNFGSGGSASVNTSLESVAVTTGWVRYTRTWTLASIAGKTIGTANSLEVRLQNPDTASTIDYWGVQLEYGAKMTPFQTASGGSIQGELAMCQRYFYRVNLLTNAGNVWEGPAFSAIAISTTDIRMFFNSPQPLRTTPSLATSGTIRFGTVASQVTVTSPSIAAGGYTTAQGVLQWAATAAVVGSGMLNAGTTAGATATIDFSAEL